VYRGVLEQNLLALYADEGELQKNTFLNLVVNDEAIELWPPWPWPPWDGDGDDDDDDDDDDGGHEDPKDPRRTIRKLAKKVVHFEQRLAEASLDL